MTPLQEMLQKHVEEGLIGVNNGLVSHSKAKNVTTQDSYCIRFCRRKFQCILLFTLLAIACLEIVRVFLDKMNISTMDFLLKSVLTTHLEVDNTTSTTTAATTATTTTTTTTTSTTTTVAAQLITLL